VKIIEVRKANAQDWVQIRNSRWKLAPPLSASLRKGGFRRGHVDSKNNVLNSNFINHILSQTESDRVVVKFEIEFKLETDFW
jgi:hypothetical protein